VSGASDKALAFVCCINGRLGICYDPATTPPKNSRCVMAHEDEHIRREHERREDGCKRGECDAPPCEIVGGSDYRKEHCDMFYADYYCVLSTPNTPPHHRKATIMRGVLCSRYDYMW
jgi:hypothetical protein